MEKEKFKQAGTILKQLERLYRAREGFSGWEKDIEDHQKDVGEDKPVDIKDSLWGGRFSEHSDSSGNCIDLNGTGVVTDAFHAIRDLVNNKIEQLEKEFKEL